MACISLVGTVHAESGLANALELLAILERIQPEVIFLEIPSTALDHYLAGIRDNVESIAVRRYRERHHVLLVPVDRPEPQEVFFRDARYLFDMVERTSLGYRRVMDRNTHRASVGGFPYLNSDLCIQAWAEIYDEVQAAVEGLGDPRLREIEALWVQTNELRDRTMMRNIEDYCLRNTFEKGVFLVGAAHRESMIAKSHVNAGAGCPVIAWDCLRFLARPD
jgi:hypothetical protein